MIGFIRTLRTSLGFGNLDHRSSFVPSSEQVQKGHRDLIHTRDGACIQAKFMCRLVHAGLFTLVAGG